MAKQKDEEKKRQIEVSASTLERKKILDSVLNIFLNETRLRSVKPLLKVETNERNGDTDLSRTCTLIFRGRWREPGCGGSSGEDGQQPEVGEVVAAEVVEVEAEPEF
jgi:hypothetical protein